MSVGRQPPHLPPQTAPNVPPPMPPNLPPPRLDEMQVLLKFLREENDATRKSLWDEGDANRRLLRNTMWIVSIPLTVLILIAGWFGYRSFEDFKKGLESYAKSQTEAEVARMKSQTEVEMARMQTEIRTTVKQQFETPRIKLMVEDAARKYTEVAAAPMIRQVVNNETKAAVDRMNSEIQGLVQNTVQARVEEDMRPVSNEITSIRQDALFQGAIIRVYADDASAFDFLSGSGSSAEYISGEQSQAIRATVADTIEAHTPDVL